MSRDVGSITNPPPRGGFGSGVQGTAAPERGVRGGVPPGIARRCEEGVWELSLGAPPCNEIGTAVLAELEAFLEEVRDGPPAHTVIIHSTLASGFCAGADLRELYAEVVARPEVEHVPAVRGFLDRIHAVMDELDMLPLTTIAVVGGLCFGGGLELALTCDIRIAEKRARFAFPELRLGLVPGFGGIPRLQRDVGQGMVRDLLLTGRSINARKAMEVGLVSQVVGRDEGLYVARALAAQQGKLDREARVTCKRFMKTLPAQRLLHEKEEFVRLFQRPAVREALRRFVESTALRPYLPE